MKHNFCIVIPTLNRFDLLLPYILMYLHNMPDVKIIIYDNGGQEIQRTIDRITSMAPFTPSYSKAIVLGGINNNIGVAQAWNVLCNHAFSEGYSHVLVINDDVFINCPADMAGIEGLITWMSNNDCQFLSCESFYDLSCFIISKKCWDEIGEFDNMFYPAYLEDNDYLYRVFAYGKDWYRSGPALNPIIFQRSATRLMGDKEFNEKINNGKYLNAEYYIRKWGGMPGMEQFRRPFEGNIKLERETKIWIRQKRASLKM